MRKSLMYPAFYLSVAGLGLVLVPDLFLKLMCSNISYDPEFARFAGLFLVGLAVIVIQTIRHRIESLYATLIAVRVFFCLGYVVLFVMTRNPFFLVVLAIVGAGLLASSISYARDRSLKQA
jgi:hypothetical protein